jgi:phage terminase Nu1 subunit (DNA packaging protein)
MFDSPHSSASFEPLLDSDRAAAIIQVHPKTLQRYARNGIVRGVRVGKLWRFRASDLIPPHLADDEEELDGDARANYAESNHSCPQLRKE